MSAPKLTGDWSVKLEPHIVKINKGGLLYDHDMKQDRVWVTQGSVTRQVGWFNHQFKALLPLSGMMHPTQAEEIHARILTQLGVDPSEWTAAPVIDDPGRNAKEQLEEMDDEE